MIKRSFLIFFLITTVYSSEIKFIKLFIHDSEFVAEVAETEHQKMMGLMFRKTIPDDYGMLFVYGNDDFRAMWMKNTLISLDFVFLNESKEVVEIIKNVPPCRMDPCKTYISKEKARYVLELNAGIANKLKLKIGDQLFFIL